MHECMPSSNIPMVQNWTRYPGSRLSGYNLWRNWFNWNGWKTIDYTDKLQPIREHDCTVCMACQEICPEGSILIESSNQEWHEKAAGTYVMMKSTSVNPHAHD